MAVNFPNSSQKKKEKKIVIIVGIFFVIGMYFFSQEYMEFSQNATEDQRYLVTAIMTGSIALGLHISKDYKKIKNNASVQLSLYSLELLLLVITPILSIFQIFLKEHPTQMLILLAAGVVSWWIVVVIKTDNVSGKSAFVSSIQIFGSMLAVMALFAWLLPFFL